MQVPDGAVRDAGAGGEGAAAAASIASSAARLTGDEAAAVAPSLSAAAAAEAAAPAAPGLLFQPRQCYTCKARYTRLHHFYAALCPRCAALNYAMRGASADLSGRVALLTGARVKIGYEIGLKLLRAGATLVATTRFPADAARRYAAEPDFGAWRGRLQLHAVDLRDVVALEGFCAFLMATMPRLDVVVNNACQTVRRPASYYAHLLGAEARLEQAVERAALPAGDGECGEGRGAAAEGVAAAAGVVVAGAGGGRGGE